MKYISFLLIILFLLILTSCFNSNGQTASNISKNNNITNTASTNIKDKENTIISKNMFVCDYIDEEDKKKYKVYIAEKAIYMEPKEKTDKNTKGIVINDEFYVWDDDKKKGFIIKLRDGNIKIKNKEMKTLEDFKNFYLQNKCNEVELIENLFLIPSDVKFVK